MANTRSNYALGLIPSRICEGSEVVPLDYSITLTSAPALNDTIEMGNLPAGHVPLDVIFVPGDLDSNGVPTIALSFGILNTAKTDLSVLAADGGAAWQTGITGAQTGTTSRLTTAVPYSVTATEADRPLAFKVTTAAATFQSGTLRVIVLARTIP